MSILHVLVLVLAVLYLFSSSERKRQKGLFIIVCGLILFCSCFRTMVEGYDTEGYVEYFHRFRSLSLKESLEWQFEPGYIILNKIIGYFTNDSQVFLSVLSILSLVPIFVVIWNRSENPLLSLLVFVAVGNLFSSYAALRQWCAVAVFTIGYELIIRRRPILFFLTVAIAYMFHQTALFMIPLFFLYSVRITRIKILSCVGLSLILMMFSGQIMQILNRFARIETAYSQNGGYILLVAYWALVFVIDLFAYPTENETGMKLNYLALLYSAIIQPMCFAYSGFSRIHLYTWFGMAMGIPRLIEYMDRDSDQRNSFLMKCIVVMIMTAWYLITQDSEGLTLIFF